MIVLEMIIAILLITVLPCAMGLIYPDARKHPQRSYVYGLVTMWAVIFVFALPSIMADLTLTVLLMLVSPVCLIMGVWGLAAYIMDRKRSSEERSTLTLGRTEILYLGLFIGLVVFQMYKSVTTAYSDGDDAYYVSVAGIANSGDSMYRADPYTGMAFLQTKRYTFASFPMWIAMIARVSGLNTATVAHVILPLVLVPATYLIYTNISGLIFKNDRQKKYLFLSLLSVFVIFSGFSTAVAEKFLLARVRQGKEALGNIIIPTALFLIMNIVGEGEDSKPKITREKLILMWVLGLAGALTSVFSNLVLVLLWGFLAIYCVIKKCDRKTVITALSAMVPELLILGLFVIK
ncbi:MAG: hypothetical protein K6E19_03535 [Lachnospiraceae bacterium]|nr:hypothetical protein [Lachnospiraceae bacterium]